MPDIVALLNAISVIYTELFPILASKSWLSFKEEDRLKLSQFVQSMDDMWSGNAEKQIDGFRKMWDQAIYDARRTGVLPTDFPSLRTERNSSKKEDDKPEPTINERLALLLGTNASTAEVTAEPEVS